MLWKGADDEMNLRRYIPVLLDNLIWILLLGVVVLFSILTDRFLTTTNIFNILIHGAGLGIAVIGLSFTLLTGNFDLSIESTIGFTALLGAWLVAPAAGIAHGSGWNVNPFLAALIMLLVGLGIGWINGNLITRAKMNNFIVTLAMLIVLRGIMLGFTQGETIAKLPSAFKALGHDKLGSIPVSIIALVVAFFIAHIVTTYRRFGRDLYAIGGNPDAALAAGVDPDKRVRHVYLVSGLLAALAGWMLAGRLGVVVPGLGQGMIFEVFAAAVIGGISLQGGRGTLIGAFGGVLLLSAIDSGLNLMRVSSFWIQTVRGLVILVAMFIDAQKVRYRAPTTTSAKVSATASVSD
jgi:ribose/xylose/arabinose/galactoside ABC-type transport system permease subunit